MVTWDDIRPGVIIRYEHLSRARRLANKPLTIRRGRVERVLPPPQVRDGQTTVTVLNKDGSVNAALGQISIYGLWQIVAIEQPDGAR
jgi:hypothetical protein